MMETTHDKLMGWGLIFAIILAVVAFGYATFFTEEKDNTLTINLTGECAKNYTASERYHLDYACLQWCAEEYYSSAVQREDCWDRCKELGCAGCNNG